MTESVDGALPDPPGTELLEVRRRKAFNSSGQPFRIFVDEEKVGAVANGAIVRVPLQPGRHAIGVKCYMSRSGKATIEVAAGQLVILECGMPGNSEWFWTGIHINRVFR